MVHLGPTNNVIRTTSIIQALQNWHAIIALPTVSKQSLIVPNGPLKRSTSDIHFSNRELQITPIMDDPTNQEPAQHLLGGDGNNINTSILVYSNLCQI